jgi:hypothetical protein
MVQDLEFEDLAAMDRFWEEWKKTAEHAAIGKAWDELGLEGLGTEYWTLE